MDKIQELRVAGRKLYGEGLREISV